MTITNDIQRRLVNYIVEHSGHDTHRGYIGLSGIADCERVIYDRYTNGSPASVIERMKTAISYDLEQVMIEKLRDLDIYGPPETISLYNALVQGHTDGRIRGDLLEIKTVEREEWFPVERVPYRVFMQVQAYLHYRDRRFAQVLYLARDTGAIQMYSIRNNPGKGLEIEDKVDRLVAAVREVIRPECSCGKCQSDHE